MELNQVVRLTGRTGPLDGALALLVARREGAWVVRPMGSRSVVPVKKEQLRVARSLSHAALLGPSCWIPRYGRRLSWLSYLR